MVKKAYQNPKGGLNQKGREYFNRTEGSNLKAPVKSGTNPRRVSFAARFGGMKGSLLTKNGDPTRLKLKHSKHGGSAVRKLLDLSQLIIKKANG
jgi:hypothetical protein